MKRSSCDSAEMCGMPHRSRITRTGAESPEISIVPETCATSGGGRGGSARQPTVMSSAQAAGASGVTLSRMAIKDGLLAEFDHEMGTTRKLLERLPEENLSWKPHER